MNIIIIGCGNVGFTLAKKLAEEDGVNVTILDNRSEALEKAGESIDAMTVAGDALNIGALIDAGVRDCDLLISVTDADEINILCCISAYHLGAKSTVARVRNPDYALDKNAYWKELGLDMIFNPERETALEISRLLRFPSVESIDVFVGGRVELVSFTIADSNDPFLGRSVSQVFHKKNMDILLALIERGDSVIIPHGDLVFRRGDVIKVIGSPSAIMRFFDMIGKNTEKPESVVIIGGGMITHYLVESLQRSMSKANIKIIEIERDKCEKLNSNFPRCVVICGDGTDESVLSAEYVDKSDAVVCLTDRDEKNALIALYASQSDVARTIVKVNHINVNLIRRLNLGSIVSPKNVTSDQIIRYIRGLQNAFGEIRTVHRIFESEEEVVEAIEIKISQKMRCLDTKLKDLRLKKGILIGCIIRGSNVIIPTGDTHMRVDDSVIIVAHKGVVNQLDDILTN